MMTAEEHREKILKAMQGHLLKKLTKEEAIQNLIKIGILTSDGQPSPIYYDIPSPRT